MADIDPDRRELLIEAGRRGARTRLLGRTTVESRRELTAAATEARRGSGRKNVEQRIAEVEAGLADIADPDERHRQIALIADLRASTPQMRELVERVRQRHLDSLADELQAS